MNEAPPWIKIGSITLWANLLRDLNFIMNISFICYFHSQVFGNFSNIQIIYKQSIFYESEIVFNRENHKCYVKEPNKMREGEIRMRPRTIWVIPKVRGHGPVGSSYSRFRGHHKDVIIIHINLYGRATLNCKHTIWQKKVLLRYNYGALIIILSYFM